MVLKRITHQEWFAMGGNCQHCGDPEILEGCPLCKKQPSRYACEECHNELVHGVLPSLFSGEDEVD